MRVRAIALGYYNHLRRREGDVFDLKDEKHFSKRWMEKLGNKKAAPSQSGVQPSKKGGGIANRQPPPASDVDEQDGDLPEVTQQGASSGDQNVI